MATRTHACTKDAVIAASIYGNNELHLFVGSEAAATENRRAYMQFSMTKPTDQTALTSAKLYIRAYSGAVSGHDTPDAGNGTDSGPYVYVDRVTGGSWSEGTSTTHSVYSSSNAITWDNAPACTSTGRATKRINDGNWNVIDITTIVAYWDANPTKNYGIRLMARDDGTDMLFYSRATSSEAYILRTYENNAAPLAPTITAPVDGTYANTTVGTDILVTGTFTDPDPSDWLSALHVEVYASTATDAVPGSPVLYVIYFRDENEPGATFTDTSWTTRLWGLARATSYRVRAKVRDTRGAWGPWSLLDNLLVTTNAVPGVPANMTVDPGSLTPHVYGTLVDNDPGATIGGAQEQWVQDVAAGTVTKWDSGQTDIGGTATRYDLVYNGTALEWGVTYRRRARVADQLDQYGAWSAWQSVTQRELIGPDTLTPNNVNTRQTVTPTIAIGNAAAFDKYEVEIYPQDEAAGTPTYSTGVVSMVSGTSASFAVPAAKLLPGRTYWLRARIELTGNANLGDWSIPVPFYTAALPSAPTSVSPGSPLVSSPVIVPSTTPELTAVWTSPDLAGYGIEPSVLDIEVETALGVAVVDENDAGPPAYTVPMAWTVTPALTNETSYRQRWRFTDPVSGAGLWSDWRYFRTSLPPTATLLAPAEAATVTDPTPVLGWTYVSPGFHAQAAYRAILTQDSTVVFDTGITVSSNTTVGVPAWTLDTALGYSWSVQVWDVQGLTGTMTAATFTTSFTTPPAPTGLTATPDVEASSIVLAWDATTLSTAEFNEWVIYRRNDPDAGYELVTVITDPATLEYADYGAAFRPNVAYRLTQDNGWDESDSADAVAALVSVEPGAWVLVVPEQERYHVELLAVMGGPHGADQPSERYVALGRSLPIVETGPMSGETGSLVARLFPEDRHLERRLREMADLPAAAVLKTPYGDAWTVRLGSIGVTPGPGADVTVTIAWQQVD